MQEKTLTQELIDLRTRGRALYAIYIVTTNDIPKFRTEEILRAVESLSDERAEIYARKYEEYILSQKSMRDELLGFIQKEAIDGI